MRRRLMIVVSGLSLLLCVASAAMWLRSYWVLDLVNRSDQSIDPGYETTLYTLHSSCGAACLTAEHRTYSADSRRATDAQSDAREIRRRPPQWTWAGKFDPEPMDNPDEPAILRSFQWRTEQFDHPAFGERCDVWSILFPWWAVTAVAAVVPTVRAILRFRRRRRAAAAMPGASPPVVRRSATVIRSVARRAIPIAAAAPPAAFLLAILLWARSYWVQDRLERTTIELSPSQPVEKRVNKWELGNGVLAWSTEWEIWPHGTQAASLGQANAAELARITGIWSWQRQRDPEPADAGWTVPPADGHFRWMMFPMFVRENGEQATTRLVTLPWWAVVAVAAPVPAVQAIAWRRRRRKRSRHQQGLCPGCGYDLRATPERCPECGMVAAIA